MKKPLSWAGKVLVTLLFAAGSLQAQCDWLGRLLQATQLQFGTDENMCKALLLPGEELDRQHYALETKLLQQQRLIEIPSVHSLLQSQENQYLAEIHRSDLGWPVHITADPIPNAFATGQMIFFHYGMVEWYLRPKALLVRLGLNPVQAQTYLAPIAVENPGKLGLLAILAHETSHNILGHPDVFPLTDACNRYLNTQAKGHREAEKETATGKTPSVAKQVAKGLLIGYGKTFLYSQERQRQESDADTFGAWLVWRQTGDPDAMAKALQWLARFPGSLPGSRSGAVFEALCSDHPNLVQRVAASQSLSFSLRTFGRLPAPVHRAPVEATAKRYQEFLKEREPAVASQINETSVGAAAADFPKPVAPHSIDARSTSSPQPSQDDNGQRLVAGDFTGDYSGVVRNLTAGRTADFKALLSDRNGAIQGCLAVRLPLHGSGSLSGTAHGSQVTFQVNSASFVLEFRGQRHASDGDIDGTYLARPTAGPLQEGTFTLHKVSGDLPSGFDTRKCPADAEVHSQ